MFKHKVRVARISNVAKCDRDLNSPGLTILICLFMICPVSRLVIGHNSINGTGLCAVAKAMEMKGNFKSVFIWGNNLEEDACVVSMFGKERNDISNI